MRIFVYEYVSGGGCWDAREHAALEPELLRQGVAMAAAVTQDFARLEGCTVLTTRDSRVPPFHSPACQVAEIVSADGNWDTFRSLASQCDRALVIAPESGGILAKYTSASEAQGARLLSPGSQMIGVCSDKHRTAVHLAARGVAVPGGAVVRNRDEALRETQALGFPVVFKPIDGCGSVDVLLVAGADAMPFWEDAPKRIERFVPGLPASVALLCGPAGVQPLPAGEQMLSTDGRFQYLGGRLPLAPGLNRRAQALAVAALRAFPSARGYVGVDLVLGNSADGSEDALIEINPRLTTSYVGLRRLVRQNLAGAMLAAERGEPLELTFGDEVVEFTPEGEILPNP